MSEDKIASYEEIYSKSLALEKYLAEVESEEQTVERRTNAQDAQMTLATDALQNLRFKLGSNLQKISELSAECESFLTEIDLNERVKKAIEVSKVDIMNDEAFNEIRMEYQKPRKSFDLTSPLVLNNDMVIGYLSGILNPFELLSLRAELDAHTKKKQEVHYGL